MIFQMKMKEIYTNMEEIFPITRHDREVMVSSPKTQCIPNVP